MTTHLQHILHRLAAAVIVVMACSMAHADNVSATQAAETARTFLAARGVKAKGVTPQRAPRRVKSAQIEEPYYIFNSDDNSAFVVVSGETRTKPILAYGLDRAFNPDSIAPEAAYLLGCYEEQIEMLRRGARPASPRREPLNNEVLLQTADWDQSWDFWWKDTPVVGGQHCHAGCVATAMAIIMRYYEWPAHGYGSHSYTTLSLGQELSVNFSNAYYHLSQLPLGNADDPQWTDQTRDWCAKFIYHCGVAANVDYHPVSTNGSGPEVGMYNHFGYTLGSYVPFEEVEDDVKWYDIVYKELDEGHPLLYRGESDGRVNGHQFVCDGYDAEGRLHFNFGWSGACNGYYYMDYLVTAYYDLSFGHGLVTGVRPDYDNPDGEKAELCIKYGAHENERGIVIQGDGKIHAETPFTLQVFKVSNSSCGYYRGTVAAFLCDKEGNRKAMLGMWDGVDLGFDYYYYWVYLDCILPDDYELEEGDCIRLFSSADQQEWHLAAGSEGVDNNIDMAAVYDPMPIYLTMGNFLEGEPVGLTTDVEGDIPIGRSFILTAHMLQTVLWTDFTGCVGAFLCTADGTPYKRIGAVNIGTMRPNSYFARFSMSCLIPKTTQTSPTDVICLMVCKGSAAPTTTNGVLVTCVDPDKTYLPIEATPVVGVAASDLRPVQYYTTQGTLLPGRPTSPGIYIVRRGNSATKQVIK